MFQADGLYDLPQDVADFAFDERVVAVFPDMIHRSIPGYATLLQMTAVVAGQFLQDGDHMYDLGCSLGGVSFAIHRFVAPKINISAVDVSSAMVARLRDYIQGVGFENITVLQEDIVKMELSPCKVVALNFVLQFIDPQVRDAVLTKVFAALPKGGVLLMAEKTHPSDRFSQAWHEAFKRSQGYSELAVAQKRESLENVMKTDDVETVIARLYKAGFSEVIAYYQGFAFMAWAALK